MLFKPYYLVQAYSQKVQKQQTQYIPNEMGRNKELMNPVEAKRRSIAYAESLNESVSMNASDWKPIVRLISDGGKYLVDLDSIK
jgi:hypothetical protein